MTRKEQIKQYKAEGHTAKEVAERFGVRADYVRRICSGIAPQGYGKGNFKSAESIEEFVSERLPEFEFADNYSGADGKCDIKCKCCGNVITRSMITIRHANVRCRVCENNRIAAREAAEQAERDLRNQERQQRKAEREAEEERKRLERLHECPVCGNVTDRPKYCSDKCQNKANNAVKDQRRRLKIKLATIDSDITVEGLYRRDNGFCWLCGGRCNYEDYTIRDGVFIAGDWYPSVDHVIPLSKGGAHSWENVKLAHRRCNSEKSNKILSE